MWQALLRIDFLGSAAGAVHNARSVLEADRVALAEVDSVVDRLQRHVAAVASAA